MNHHEPCLTKKQAHWGTLGLWFAGVSWRQQQPPLSHRQHHAFEIEPYYTMPSEIGCALGGPFLPVQLAYPCPPVWTMSQAREIHYKRVAWTEKVFIHNNPNFSLHLNGCKPSLVPSSDTRLSPKRISSPLMAATDRELQENKKVQYNAAVRSQWSACALVTPTENCSDWTKTFKGMLHILHPSILCQFSWV